MIALIAAHAIAALVAPAVVHRWGAKAFWALALAPASAAAWALTQTSSSASDSPPTQSWAWVPSLGMELTFRLDSLAWLLTLVVGGIGALVLGYCAEYFDDDEPGLGLFAGSLVAFAGAMLALVTSDDMLILYLAWEATTVLSYLLIGHKPEDRPSRAAAQQALVVTTLGGLAMLVGIIIIGEHEGTYRLSEVIARATSETAPTLAGNPVIAVAVFLLLLGGLSKSALFPFHFWLPGAMAAPTPVSAYLHAAAMVKAGIYLIARLAPAYATAPIWRWTVLVLGGGTMILGAYRALRQHDLKLLLAYGTVSQLGFLVVLVGTGTQQAALAGVTMLAAHALYKGALFLSVGAIDHATGTRDLRRLTGLRRKLPLLAAAATLAAASMAGLPPLLGFVGKEAVYATYAESSAWFAPYVLVVLVTGSVLTVGYSARFVWGAFRNDSAVPPPPVHHLGPALVGIPAVLALASLVAGIASKPLEPLLLRYADTLPADTGEVHLGLWHGVNAALLLSLLTLALGTLLFLGRAPFNTAQTALATRMEAFGAPMADDAYRATMRALDRRSLQLTASLQRGSLPLSLGLILTVFVIVVGGVAVAEGPDLGPWRPSDGAAQVATALVVAACALMTVRSRRRLRAVFLVGGTGYGVALLFLLHGAPDLALTQVLVETVSIIVFVLVLRRLPGHFDPTTRQNRLLRLGFGIAVGSVATWLALTIPQVRSGSPASTGLEETAKSFGGGNNIVNVTLVDIRAWDTMGELSVVIAAATGIASLIFIREANLETQREKNAQVRQQRRETRNDTSARDEQRRRRLPWLDRSERLARTSRSLMLEVVTRLVFHSVMMWSLFELFAGHNSPGGGFAAGLVGGLAITARYLAGGREELRVTAPIMPGLLLGAGLFLSAGNGLVSMLAGGQVLQTWIFDFTLPVFGDVHLVTSVFFDLGVYLVVVGLMLDILRSLGAAIDVRIERDADQADAQRRQARPTRRRQRIHAHAAARAATDPEVGS